MKKRHRRTFWICLALAGLLWSATLVWAQVSADYAVTWHVMGSGGPTVSSNAYHVEWTLGQPFVGAASSEAVREQAGFWAGFVSMETPQTPVTPETPQTPEPPETPQTPETPETPETPQTPETPETPQTPQTPETPETPEAPEIFVPSVTN